MGPMFAVAEAEENNRNPQQRTVANNSMFGIENNSLEKVDMEYRIS